MVVVELPTRPRLGKMQMRSVPRMLPFLRSLLALSVAALAGCGASGKSPAPFALPAETGQADPARPASATGGLDVEVAIEDSAPRPAPTPEPTPAIRAATLSVLTWNTWGLPAPIGKDLHRRFQAMLGVLGGFDFVGLQETFTGEAKALLTHTLYPYSHRQESTEFMRLGSGLTVLSRHRILETDFRPFEQCADTDCLAQKGVLFTRVLVTGLGPVDFYNTHYQAHGPYKKERLHDNDILARFVRSKDAGHPTFLLGDFNMREGSEEYQDLMMRLDPIDLYRYHRPAEKGGTSSGGARIDYLFYRPARGFDLRVLDSAVMFQGLGLSDHNGVRVDVRISALR